MNDVGYALRGLRGSPAFAFAAAITIALGIAAATAVFTVTDAVLLRPLPYRDPGRLVLVGIGQRGSSAINYYYSNADFSDLRDATNPAFEDIGGVCTFRAFVPREDGGTEQIAKALVTPNFFRLLGARVVLGRDFTDSDGQPQSGEPAAPIPAGSVAILSHEYWQRRYGGDPGVLGREMLTSGQHGLQIVGVLAPGFRLYGPPGSAATPEFFVANNGGYDAAHRNVITAGGIARLRKGASPMQAQAQVDAVAPELRKKLARFPGSQSIVLEPVQQRLVAEARPAIVALMGSVLFLLLIACANVGNLLLVRVSSRRRDLAIRTALGARRSHIVRQTLAEAVLLAAAGTILGVGIAWLGLRKLMLLVPRGVPRIESAGIDWRVLAFAALAGLGSAVLLGLMPAWNATRTGLMESLRGGPRAGGPGGGRRLRDGAVIGEFALCFALLVGAGLMLRSFLELRRIDPGYDARGVLTFQITREWPVMRQDGRQELLREIQSRLGTLPGVKSVAASVRLPLAGGGPPPVRGTARAESADGADFQFVLPGYFEALGTPLLAGRWFTEADNAPGRAVVVIDALLATRAFPGQPAVGRRILLPFGAPWAEVIGVVAHQRMNSLADPGVETIYFADGFDGVGVSRYWAVRTGGDPGELAAVVRTEVAKIDRQLVISKMQPMEALIEQDQAGTRFTMLLIGGFGSIAALLAAVGLYGVLATVVRQRTPEIGVRMALGAAPAGVFRLVVGHGVRLGLAGVIAGILLALGLTRFMAAMLVGVKPTDPTTLASVAVLSVLLAAAASWLPARRATRIDPAAALRDE